MVSAWAIPTYDRAMITIATVAEFLERDRGNRRWRQLEARQTEAAVFGYGISAAGNELVQWNCNLFPELEEAGLQCLPRPHRLL